MYKPYYSICCVAALAALLSMPTTLALANDQFTAKEKDLIETLRSGEPEQKALACKQLAIYGTKDAVPELAKLLSDQQLASWSRIALEAIPDPAADEALSDALDSLDGNLLIGVINSIGVRRDGGAAGQLAAQLKNANIDVASAAAVTLGKIGNGPATKALRQSLATSAPALRPAIAEGCVLCAERLMADGNAGEASEIYDEVRRADVPKQRILEATRGAILARGNDGIPLLIDQINSDDRELIEIGLITARELPGREVADALAAELANTTPDRAALILVALADRDESYVSPAVFEAAKSGDTQVQLAAIGLIGRSNDESNIATLLEIATDDDAVPAQAAKAALAGLPGDEVNERVLAALASAKENELPVLFELIGQRRIDATPALVEALDHSAASIRGAALTALGETVRPKDIDILISHVIEPKHPEDSLAAERALKAACIRMPDREECAKELAAAMPRALNSTQRNFLEILGAMGGPTALKTIGAAATANETELQDTSSRLLGEWMTADAAPVLLELANDSKGHKYQVRALRGYIRIARQFSMPDDKRAEMCENALNAAHRSDEQKMVLAVLERYPNADSLRVAEAAAKTPAIKDDARRVALAIAEKVATVQVDSGGGDQ